MDRPTTFFLIRANDQAKAVGEAALKTVIVPLDGSPLAETVLPYVVDLAKKIRLEVVLMRLTLCRLLLPQTIMELIRMS